VPVRSLPFRVSDTHTATKAIFEKRAGSEILILTPESEKEEKTL